MIEHYGGSLGRDPMLVKEVLNRASNKVIVADPTSTAYKAAIPKARERFLAYAFLRCSDPHRYRKMISDLSNQYSRGTIQYPDDITTAFSMLENFKDDSKSTKKRDDEDDKKDDMDDAADASFLISGQSDNKSNKSKSPTYSNSSNCTSSSSNTVQDSSATTATSMTVPSVPPSGTTNASPSAHDQAVSFLLDAFDNDATGTSLDMVSDNIDTDYCFYFDETISISSSVAPTEQNLDHIFAHANF